MGTENDWVGYLRKVDRASFSGDILDKIAKLDPGFRLYRVDCMNWINYHKNGFRFAACVHAAVYEKGGKQFTIMLNSVKLTRRTGIDLGKTSPSTRKKAMCC